MDRIPCGFCDHTWATDPVFAVPCPECTAKAGKKCKRPSEHDVTHKYGRGWHVPRDMAAARAGAYHHECSRPCPKSCGTCHPPEAVAAVVTPRPSGVRVGQLALFEVAS